MTVRARGMLFGLLVSFISLAAHAQDHVILRDGTSGAGKLQTCTAESCWLSGQAIKREKIAWIGLGPAQKSPPRVTQTATDEVHLVDGSVRTGPVIGVSLGAVAQSGSLDRSQVRWIHFVISSEPSTARSQEKPGQPSKPGGWTGTMTSQSAQTSSGKMICSGNWTTTISFVVNHQGEIHGQATATLTGRECSHPEWYSNQEKEITYEITGTATPQQLQFRLKAVVVQPAGSVDFTGFAASIINLGGIPATFTAPIDAPGHARGEVSLRYQAGAPNLYTSSSTIALQCKDC